MRSQRSVAKKFNMIMANGQTTEEFVNVLACGRSCDQSQRVLPPPKPGMHIVLQPRGCLLQLLYVCASKDTWLCYVDWKCHTKLCHNPCCARNQIWRHIHWMLAWVELRCCKRCSWDDSYRSMRRKRQKPWALRLEDCQLWTFLNWCWKPFRMWRRSKWWNFLQR